MADLPQLTDQQRKQLIRAMDTVQAAFEEFAKALRAAGLRVTADQFILHTEALQRPVHVEITVRPDPSHVAEAIRDIRRHGGPPQGRR